MGLPVSTCHTIHICSFHIRQIVQFHPLQHQFVTGEVSSLSVWSWINWLYTLPCVSWWQCHFASFRRRHLFLLICCCRWSFIQSKAAWNIRQTVHLIMVTTWYQCMTKEIIYWKLNHHPVGLLVSRFVVMFINMKCYMINVILVSVFLSIFFLAMLQHFMNCTTMTMMMMMMIMSIVMMITTIFTVTTIAATTSTVNGWKVNWYLNGLDLRKTES